MLAAVFKMRRNHRPRSVPLDIACLPYRVWRIA